MASILDKVDVHDAGDKIILSSDDEVTLKYVVEEMRKEGAEGIQVPVKVGSKWVASFEHPALSQCTVEKLGFVIIIAGHTEESVLARRAHTSRSRRSRQGRLRRWWEPRAGPARAPATPSPASA